MRIRVVVFDVGETLVDEGRLWDGWADHLGVPRHEFRSALEDVIAKGQHHHRVFDRFRPQGFDIEAARHDRIMPFWFGRNMHRPNEEYRFVI